MARRDLASYGLDRWILALAFGAGAFGTIALKAMEVPQWAPAAFAGGVIVAYAAITWFLRSARLEPEQIGDNAYYLGFVLTLCSLAYTLWSLGTVEAETALIAEVVAGFGVALTSTVVGVAVRVFLMQFRLDLVAREREAQAALSDGTAAFRSEIADVIRGTRYLGVEIRQTLAEHHRDMAAADAARAERATERLIDLMETAMSGFADRSGSVQSDLERRGEEIAAQARERLDRLADDAARSASEEAERLEARLSAASALALDAAEARLLQAIARFEASANRSSAALAASTAAIGQSALAELRAHRAEMRSLADESDDGLRAIDGGR